MFPTMHLVGFGTTGKSYTHIFPRFKISGTLRKRSANTSAKKTLHFDDINFHVALSVTDYT